MKDVNSPARNVGRPRGSRNKLAENFLADLAALWEEQGESVLRRALFAEPMKFSDMVARLLPAKIEIKNETFVQAAVSALDDERLAELLDAYNAAIDDSERQGLLTKLIDVTPTIDALASPTALPTHSISTPQDGAAAEGAAVVDPHSENPFAFFHEALAREQEGGRDGGA